MANAKNERTFLSELTAAGLYKRNQGRLTRQLTFLALLAVVILGAKTLYDSEILSSQAWTNGAILGAITVVGGWAIFRLVNYPRFADFLISVEAEMDKVTWASKEHLKQATVVVISTMFFLGFLLFAYDWLWMQIFRLIGFLEI